MSPYNIDFYQFGFCIYQTPQINRFSSNYQNINICLHKSFLQRNLNSPYSNGYILILTTCIPIMYLKIRLFDSVSYMKFWDVTKGKVVDVCMSWKRRKSNTSPFAFVSFSQLRDAEKVIQNLHGLIIRDCKISISMTKHRRVDTRTCGQDNMNRTRNQDQ